MSSAVQPLPLANTTASLPWPASWRACLPPAAATAAWHLLLLVSFVVPFHGDLSALVCASPARVGRPPHEAIHVGMGRDGFDGQHYYALARDPWHVRGEPIDLPVYRHMRLLYPALAWLLSGGGDPVRLLWAMPAINVLAAAGLAWLGALVAVRHGRGAWWGYLLPVLVNVGMLAMRDLTDPLAALTACGLLTAWLLRWRPGACLAWAVAAVLSREQNAAVVLIVLLDALLQRQRRHAVGMAFALALLAAWIATLRVAYGAWPVAGDTLGPPLAWLGHQPAVLGQLPTRLHRAIHVAGLATLALEVGLCLVVCVSRVNRAVRLLALVGLLLTAVAGAALFTDEWNYLRVLLWMPLAVWFGSVLSGRRWPVVLLSPIGLWPFVPIIGVWLK
jgi:hypothetical protein